MLLDRNKQKLISIPVNKIVPNPAQPRKRFSSEEICSLADSISQNGVIQPIVVHKSSGEFVLIAGERRLRAAKVAGLRHIPAVLTECTSRESATLALIENLQRQDLSIFEEATAINSLVNYWGVTQEVAAKKLSMSQSTLANKLRLLRLMPSELRKIEENGLTERHARALLRIEGEEDRQKILDAIVKNGLNVKKSEELIEKILYPTKKRTLKSIVPKDIRLFINTIDHAVSTMLTAGIEAKAERKETEDYIECIVRIPKHL